MTFSFTLNKAEPLLTLRFLFLSDMIQDVWKISLLLIIKVYARENNEIEVHDPYSRELLKFIQYNSRLDKGFEQTYDKWLQFEHLSLFTNRHRYRA